MVDQVYFATEQLDDAISLLEEGSSVSALTLAGAADELLDKMPSDRLKQSYLEYKYEELGPVITELLPLSKEDFINENRALITVKRATSTWSNNPDDLEREAHSMIVRALCKYNYLGLRRTARMLEFENRLLEIENRLMDRFYDDWGGPITY
jgi:hypothetical protein